MSDNKVYPITVRFYSEKRAEIDLYKRLVDSADDNGRNLNDEIKQIIKGHFAKGRK